MTNKAKNANASNTENQGDSAKKAKTQRRSPVTPTPGPRTTPEVSALIYYCARSRQGRHDGGPRKPPTLAAISKYSGLDAVMIKQLASVDDWPAMRRATQEAVARGESPVKFLRKSHLATRYSAIPATAKPGADANRDPGSGRSPHLGPDGYLKDQDPQLYKITPAWAQDAGCTHRDSSRELCPDGHTTKDAVSSGTQSPAEAIRAATERQVRSEQATRLDRLKAVLDRAIEESAHDAGKLKQAVDAAARLHELERKQHGIEDKPPETRAIALLPDIVSAEEWQRRHAPAPGTEDTGAPAPYNARRH